MAKEDTTDQQSEDLEEQSDKDQAEGEESGVEGDEEDAEQEDGTESDGDASEGDEREEIQLISDKRYDELKGDPAALMKELNRAATQKFQDLKAAKRVLEPYADFITSYEEDPRAAAMQLAEELGIKVEKPTASKSAEEVVENLVTRIHGRVKRALGDDYADLADKLTVAIHDAAEIIVDERLKPIEDDQDALARRNAITQAERITERFTEEYPDWRKYEGKMQKLSKQFLPVKGGDPFEYMRSLYVIASNGKAVDSKVKKAVKGMAESARKASENRSRTASSSTVVNDPGRLLTFKEAAAMAARGERLE